MIKVQNLNGEIINVLNVELVNNEIVAEARRPRKTARFYKQYPMMLPNGTSSDGRDKCALAEGWSLAAKAPRKPRQPKQNAPKQEPKNNEPQTKNEPKQEKGTVTFNRVGNTYEARGNNANIVEKVCGRAAVDGYVSIPSVDFDDVVWQLAKESYSVQLIDEPDAPKQEPVRYQHANEPNANIANGYAIDLAAGVDAEELKNELTAKYGSMGSDIFSAAEKLANIIRPTAQVNEKDVERIVDIRAEQIVAERMEQWAKSGRAMTRTINVVTPRGRNTVDGVVCKDFEIYCNVVEAGKPLYFYGPAGCGKSYTARQIATSLGYDYYETSQAMFAHELKGYGDAKGEFVETAFYRAFSKGGVFFLDEVDASAPEALVVLNNAIANKRFDFPVIGNIEAHPDFRVIAAGNTRMTGATLQYTARQMQDTSFKNRFLFELVSYDRDLFLAICDGDEEIVNFGADLRKAARETGISQLFSYRQGDDLAHLQTAYLGNDARLLRASVLQEKELDDTVNLYEHLTNKNNRWAKAMKACIETMKTEEVW